VEEVEEWKVERSVKSASGDLLQSAGKRSNPPIALSTYCSAFPSLYFSTFAARVVVIIVVLVTAWSLALPRRAVSLPALPADFTAPVRGAIHVHTRRSDGTGTVDAVAAAAERAGLSFIVLTDHGDGTLPPELPAYRGRVLVIDAVEISTEGGHIVALGMKPAPYPLGGEPRDVIEDVKRLDGFAIAAHPASAKSELQWTDWSLPIDGLEWINGDSEWRDESAFSLVRTLLTYPGRGRESLAALLDYPAQLMERWDALGARRQVVAVAAADAHARIGFRNLGEPYDRRALLPLPSYETVFSTFSIALPDVALTGNASADAAAVLNAIGRGQLYSTMDALAGPGALSFEAVDRTVLRARIHAQRDARIVLFKDGHELKTASEGALEHDAAEEPGVYRVEVRLTASPGAPPIPWIVSNAIPIGRPAAAEPAAARPRRATEFRAQYGDGPATGWTVEQGAQSAGAIDRLGAMPGSQLAFRFALSGPRSQSPYAAMVMPAGADIDKYDRLMFTARASRPMRVSVQLRAPGGVAGQRWHRSVFIDPTPREITVFFDDMRPRGITAAPRPVPGEVESVLFVIDTVNADTGTNGQFVIDEVRYAR
jgi:hypothetical protein